ncbi:hypothetical protein ABZX30_12680 [Streptomyces sp. NPDC004542]|uniref:hypothetical protein n=1 Tax=Streptomyces sp. NPDC004542 TaxID=3154281 RepID=UPI0033B9714C
MHTRVWTVPGTEGEPYRAFLVRLVEEGGEDTAAAACEALAGRLTPGATEALRVLSAVMADPDRPQWVWRAAAQQLPCFPPGPVAEAAARSAFDALAGRARADDPEARVEALRRLHQWGEDIRPGLGHGTALHLLDGLAGTLESVGLHADAARLSWEVAVEAVRHGIHEEQRWKRLARLCETGPGRIPGTAGHVPVNLDRPLTRAALLAAARSLRTRATAVSGLLALALVRVGGDRTGWAEPWRAELAALRAHEDPDVALGALLVVPDRSG